MKIFLGGDVCPKHAKVNDLFRAGDAKALFSDVAPIMQEADLTFVNLECCLGDKGEPIKKFGPNLRACAETAQTLKAAGVDLVGLSNNHYFDYGKAAVVESVKALDAAGLAATGYGKDYEDSRKNYVVEKDGQKICFIAVCEHEYSYALPDREGSRPYDPYDTIWDIRKAKEQYDRVIVIYHGGKEHCQYPSPRVRQAFHAMAKNGADVVVGQHSHCVCCYEQVEGAHLFYGQGNFHFLWEGGKPTWDNALEMIYDTKTNEVSFVPTVHDYTTWGIRLANEEEKKAILEGFEERNKSLQDGTWKDGWHAFAESVKENYLANIKPADVFGHYLDCEAHTDVWRELFYTYNWTNEK